MSSSEAINLDEKVTWKFTALLSILRYGAQYEALALNRQVKVLGNTLLINVIEFIFNFAKTERKLRPQ